MDSPGSPNSPAAIAVPSKPAGTQRKCANCGQVGHIKTNKKWVYSSPAPSSSLCSVNTYHLLPHPQVSNINVYHANKSYKSPGFVPCLMANGSKRIILMPYSRWGLHELPSTKRVVTSQKKPWPSKMESIAYYTRQRFRSLRAITRPARWNVVQSHLSISPVILSSLKPKIVYVVGFYMALSIHRYPRPCQVQSIARLRNEFSVRSRLKAWSEIGRGV